MAESPTTMEELSNEVMELTARVTALEATLEATLETVDVAKATRVKDLSEKMNDVESHSSLLELRNDALVPTDEVYDQDPPRSPSPTPVRQSYRRHPQTNADDPFNVPPPLSTWASLTVSKR